MVEPSLTSQLLGAGMIAIISFVAGFVTCLIDVKKEEKKKRQQAKIQELLDLQEEYTREIKASVWEDLKQQRKSSIIGVRAMFGKKSKRIRELEKEVDRLRAIERKYVQLLNASLDREYQLLERKIKDGNNQ